MDTDDLLNRTAELLRSRGERMTGPRRAVLTALANHPGHHSVDDLARLVAEIDGTVHRSSVYRCLETLGALGLVQHVHVGHGTTLYQLSTTPELHAQCRRCGAMLSLPSEVLDPAAEALLTRHGFVLDVTHVALSGTCADCRGA